MRGQFKVPETDEEMMGLVNRINKEGVPDDMPTGFTWGDLEDFARSQKVIILRQVALSMYREAITYRKTDIDIGILESREAAALENYAKILEDLAQDVENQRLGIVVEDEVSE